MQEIFKITDELIRFISADKIVRNSINLNDNLLTVTGTNLSSFSFNLSDYKNIYPVAIGKASAFMAMALKEKLKDKLNKGIILTKYGFVSEVSGFEIFEAGHPVPDENGLKASERIIKLLNETGKNDLIIFLISGGASSLFPLPEKGLTLQDKIVSTQLLLNSGANINELNDFRTYLSGIKGGKILKYCYPSKVVSLIISDVVGDELKYIGSGLTVTNNVKRERIESIVDKYNLKDKLPSNVVKFITSQKDTNTPEKFLPDVDNILIGNNILALNKAKELLEARGFVTRVITNRLIGEARVVGKTLAKEAIKVKKSSSEKIALLFGGETTVTVNGNGKGGRNQELALAAAIELDGHKDITLVSFGTDGNDGPTDAAGAIVNGNTVKKALQKNLVAKDYLNLNDSYNFFNNLGSLIKTGPTNTNLMDIQIVLINYSI